MKKVYTFLDLERLEKEYNNANSKIAQEYILLMIHQVKKEIGSRYEKFN